MVVFFSVDLPEVQHASRVWEDLSAQVQAAQQRLSVARGVADTFGDAVSTELDAYLDTWIAAAHASAVAAAQHSDQLAKIVSTSVEMDITAASHFKGLMPWHGASAFTEVAPTAPSVQYGSSYVQNLSDVSHG